MTTFELLSPFVQNLSEKVGVGFVALGSLKRISIAAHMTERKNVWHSHYKELSRIRLATL